MPFQRLPAFSRALGVLLHILSASRVNQGLIWFWLLLEPGQHIRVKMNSNLFLERSIELAAFRGTPVRYFWGIRVGDVNALVLQRQKLCSALLIERNIFVPHAALLF